MNRRHRAKLQRQVHTRCLREIDALCVLFKFSCRVYGTDTFVGDSTLNVPGDDTENIATSNDGDGGGDGLEGLASSLEFIVLHEVCRDMLTVEVGLAHHRALLHWAAAYYGLDSRSFTHKPGIRLTTLRIRDGNGDDNIDADEGDGHYRHRHEMVSLSTHLLRRRAGSYATLS